MFAVCLFCHQDGSVVFVPKSRTDGLEFEPSTRSQPARYNLLIVLKDMFRRRGTLVYLMMSMPSLHVHGPWLSRRESSPCCICIDYGRRISLHNTDLFIAMVIDTRHLDIPWAAKNIDTVHLPTTHKGLFQMQMCQLFLLCHGGNSLMLK